MKNNKILPLSKSWAIRMIFLDMLYGKKTSYQVINYFKKINYSIPQGEIYALNFLKKISSGKVLVYDNECLQCEYHTEYKLPSFANLRNYVQKYSGHQIIYNKSVFQAKTRGEAKTELKKTKAKYAYLVKFENYFEKLPFSPGDLGVEKIFSNANAEIWRVIE